MTLPPKHALFSYMTRSKPRPVFISYRHSVHIPQGAYAWTIRRRLEDVISFTIREPLIYDAKDVKLVTNGASDQFLAFQYEGQLVATSISNTFYEVWWQDVTGTTIGLADTRDSAPSFERLQDYEIT